MTDPAPLPLARSSHEAHLHIDLTACACGARGLPTTSAVIALPDGSLGRRYTGTCPDCGRERVFTYRLPDVPLRADGFAYGGDEPSQLLDAGQWLWASDFYARGVAPPSELVSDDDRRRARGRLAAAVAAIDEVLKFVPAGQDRVPRWAVWTPLGEQVRAAEGERLSAGRLGAVRAAYAGVLADLDPGPPARAGEAQAGAAHAEGARAQPAPAAPAPAPAAPAPAPAAPAPAAPAPAPAAPAPDPVGDATAAPAGDATAGPEPAADGAAAAPGKVRIAGARYAFGVAHPAAPVLRVRYRQGVPVDPWGFPEWLPYARTVVALPPAAPDLTADEARVVDVRTADRVARADGDPLWTGAVGTPPGWTWALRAQERQAALVPAELHAGFRHLGGVAAPPGGGAPRRPGRGLRTGDGGPPRIAVTQRLTEEALAQVEEILGLRLPEGYRDYLFRTNGGGPTFPAVHPGHGFVLDQPLFGVRDDRAFDLGYASAFLTDRLTGDWLAVGYVQGGLLALRVRGAGAGAVAWLDDDDPRARDDDTAAGVCGRLLHPVADDFPAFWLALRAVPAGLEALAAAAAARVVTPPGAGALLPPSHRRPS